MERTMERYGIRYQVFAPDTRELEALLAERGPNLFYFKRDAGPGENVPSIRSGECLPIPPR